MKLVIRTTYTIDVEDGTTKRVSAQFLTEVETYGKGEEVCHIYARVRSLRDFSIGSMGVANFDEVFLDENGDRFFSAKCRYFEESSNGKKMARKHLFLVQASNMDEANEAITKITDESIIDYEVVEVKESQIFDVIDKDENVIVKKTPIENATSDEATSDEEGLFDTPNSEEQ